MEWKDWCRLCASTDGKCLTVFENLDQLLPEKIFKYLSITIHNQDEMPQTVCDACSRRVTVFDRFADQCLQVQSLFKALLQQKNEGTDDSDRIAMLRDEFLTNSDGFRQIDSPPPLPCPPAPRMKEEAEQMSIEVDPFLLSVAAASAGAGAGCRAGRGGGGRGRRARGRGRGRGGSRGRGRRVPTAPATTSPAGSAGSAAPAPARRGRGGPGRRASHRANSRLQAQLRHADDDDEEEEDEEQASLNHVAKVKLEPTAESEAEEDEEEDDEEEDDDEKDSGEETVDSGASGKLVRKRRGGAKKDKALVGAAKRKAQTPRVLKHKAASEAASEGALAVAAASPPSPSAAGEERLAEKTAAEQARPDSCPVPASEADAPEDTVKDDPDPFGDTGFDDYDSPDETDKPQPNEERADHGDQPSIFRWECHVCKEVFRNWNSLSVHCRQTHDVPAQVVCLCAKVLASRASIIKHRLKHTNAYKYKCDKCDKAFHRKSLFDLHMLSHVPKEEQPYVCCKCARRFHCEALLRHHERVHLPREERLVYPCSVCAKKFSSRSNVSAHLKAVHFGERPFVCDQCGHSFTSKGILQEHLTIHSDETPFKCTQCKKSFKTKYRLKIHMDTHRETPYQCPICPHQLSTRRTLRMHLLVHRDVKAYQCATCGKAFKRSKDLKNHHNLHTGVRPYTCTFCPRTFANGSNCRAHKRKMHPEELRAYEAQLAAAAEAGEAPPPPPPRAIAPPPPGSGQQQLPGSVTLQATPTGPPAPAASPSQSTGPPPAAAHAAIDIVQPSSDLKPTDHKSPSAVIGVAPCTEYDRHIMYEGSGGGGGGDNGLKSAVTHGSRPQDYAPAAAQMSRALPPHLSDLARLGENGLCRGGAASDLEAAVGARAMAMNLNARRGGGDLLNNHLGTLAPLNLNVSEMQHANRQHQQPHQHPALNDGGGGLTDLEDGGGYLAAQRRGEAYGGGRTHMGLAAVGLGALSASGLGTGLPMHRQQQIQPQQQQQQGMPLNHRAGAAGMHPGAQHAAPDPQAYHLYQHHGDAMPSAMAAAIAHSAGGMSVPAFPGNPYIHHNMGYSRGGNVM